MEKQDKSKSKLAILARDVENKLDEISAATDKYKKEVESDYERFFRWHAEDAYKNEVFKREYRHLKTRIDEGDLEKVREWVRQRVDRLTAMLLESGGVAYSVSASGVANLYELEAKRKLRERYLMMLDFIGGQEDDAWL